VTKISDCDEIPVLKRYLPDLDKVYVYPLCDLHFGETKSFDEKKFRGYLKVIADVPEAYCIFNGDLINCGLPGGTGGEDFWTQDPLTPQDQNDTLVTLVQEYGIEDKILAIVGGSNHPGRAMKAIGHNYDKQFAQNLGLLDRYVDPICLLFLGVGKRKKSTETHHKGTSTWYSIITTHGWAGGRLAGSSINSTRELGAIYAADCVITSHRHLDAGTKDEFYLPDYHNKSVNKMKRIFVSAGTFLKYSPYAVRKGMRPNGTGTPRIRFDGTKKDVHVSI
jgi:hypothetical protein